MAEAEFNYNSRQNITKMRSEQLKERIRRLTGEDKKIAEALLKSGGRYCNVTDPGIREVAELFYQNPGMKPSEWFGKKGWLPGTRAHGGLLDAFVPREMQESFLYIVDKLNRFPYSIGWNRRSVRTAGYGPQTMMVFTLLATYEKLFYCGTRLEDVILQRLEPEKLDYVRADWVNFRQCFSYLYAAEIDRGNQAVIGAIKELVYSENNTAYLTRKMILGILRSDNREMHRMLGDLLLAARLQEGLRQAICETMDEGTVEAFLTLLQVIEENDLIRFASVKRAVSTWIGIFDENSVDRVNGKLLGLMGRCLRDEAFLLEQLKTSDSIAISAALWAEGFRDIDTAIGSMRELIDHGTKNQRLTASFYNQLLYDDRFKSRIAKYVILGYDGDLELAACFMDALTCTLSGDIDRLFEEREGARYGYYEIRKPVMPRLENFYEGRQEAEALYDNLGKILAQLPKKGVTYDPCIFPWYQVSLAPAQVICQMALTAYVLQDEEKITWCGERLKDVTADGYGAYRSHLINLLLYAPSNARQREILIGYVGNAEEMTSNKAFQMVKRLKLGDRDFALIEDMLRFKRSALRKQLIDLLMTREDEGLKASLGRLLADKKEEKRTAALDMLMQIRKDSRRKELAASLAGLEQSIEAPTDKEKILIRELSGQGGEQAENSTDGESALYDPAAELLVPEREPDRGVIGGCLPLPEKQVIGIIKKLDDLIDRYRDYEYESADGEKILLGAKYKWLAGAQKRLHRLEYYPLEDVFRAFYQEEIKSYDVFVEMETLLLLRGNLYGAGKWAYEAVFGKTPFKPEAFSLKYQGQVNQVLQVYRTEFLDRPRLFKESVEVITALTKVVSLKNKRISFKYQGWGGTEYTSSAGINTLPMLNRYFEGLKYWETDEEFTQAFQTACRFELKSSEERKMRRFLWEYREPMTPIRFFWFLKACRLGLVSVDILCKAVMEYLDITYCLDGLCQFMKGDSLRPENYRRTVDLLGETFYEEMKEKGCAYMRDNTEEGALCKTVYDRLVGRIVDVELRRGDSETEFSHCIHGITYISGVDYLVRILMALGSDTLGRQSYYGWFGGPRILTKKENLGSLLKYCYPGENETAADLARGLKGTRIRERRLVEVAMYAPQWIDIIEEHLGWKGMKSGCYYFMAHMDERFDDRKQAMIARYTPLSPEELQAGAFDVNWFKEAYELLGAEHFDMLYDGAKYISDGQKHSRARKYADAALGRVTLEQLKTEISAKRNKDLLMSFGLVPFGEDRERDLMDRYQFIQQFLKESRQFGAQRRASEGQAVQTALLNLSVNAGYADVTRLTLNVESRMTSLYEPYMEWKPVDDVEVKLEIDSLGRSAILCRKGGKALKSVPSRLGKQPLVLELKDVNKKLKDQYSRTRAMMEEAMEGRTEFAVRELRQLFGNPVVRAVLEPLVFAGGEMLGFLRFGGEGEAPAGRNAGELAGEFTEEFTARLTALDGTESRLGEDETLRIAHPLDLYRTGNWHDYQRRLFENKVKQPFKQVFRELYVKLPEEMGQRYSRLFAGYQIQPKKTVACLRGRRWVADYEEGLQKVFYKENIVARIYALADWFSPGDVEAPTLEWVEFSNRKTFEALTIDQVPDVIYSEVMRDVDLAVSVAHAGGVDPETSHSTVEMRRAIVEFNLPLFGLKNVTLSESHALIKGTRGNYTVHLGSGVVHQEGGTMLNILPVHSQSRGKLFLPFVDEDPKTAEIMSKIVLLAEDKKIKDPFILDQIR